MIGIRRLISILLGLSLGGYLLWGYIAGTLPQEPRLEAAGDYCIEGFYQYVDGYLKLLDSVTGEYIDIGTNVSAEAQLQSNLPVANQDIDINATGYSTIDNQFYSIITDPINTDDPEFNGLSGSSANTHRPNFVHLAVTDPATGFVTDLGEVYNINNSGQTLRNVLRNAQSWFGGSRDEWGPTSISMGDMNGNFLYVAIGGRNDIDNNIYEIDVTNNTFRKINVTYTTQNSPGTVELGGDLVYHDGFLYSLEGAHSSTADNPSRLVRINLATGQGYALDIASLPHQDRTYGALWIAFDGTEYHMYANDTGNSTGDGTVYEITNFVSGTPGSKVLVKTEVFSRNDGMSCPDADVPAFGIDAVDDEDSTSFQTPLIIDTKPNDRYNLEGDMSNWDTLSESGGTVVYDPITETFVYTPATGFYGIDRFNYTICLPLPSTLCDTATVTITVTTKSELFIDKQDDYSDGQVVYPGDIIRYTITYGHHGDIDHNLLNETLTETVPLGTTYLDNGLWDCSDLNGNQVFDGGDTCIATTEELYADSEYQIEFEVKVDDNIDITNQGQIDNIVYLSNSSGESISSEEVTLVGEDLINPIDPEDQDNSEGGEGDDSKEDNTNNSAVGGALDAILAKTGLKPSFVMLIFGLTIVCCIYQVRRFSR